MTDAQIALYAALRVNVPGEWRICGHASDLTQVVYFTRPVLTRVPAELECFRFVPPGALPLMQEVGIEKLALAVDRTLLEGPHCAEVIRSTVIEAGDLLRPTP